MATVKADSAGEDWLANRHAHCSQINIRDRHEVRYDIQQEAPSGIWIARARLSGCLRD